MLDNSKHEEVLSGCNPHKKKFGAAAAEAEEPIHHDELESAAAAGAGKEPKQIPKEEWTKQKEKHKDTACPRAVKGIPCAYHDDGNKCFYNHEEGVVRRAKEKTEAKSKAKGKKKTKEKAKGGRPRKRNSSHAGNSKLPTVAGLATHVHSSTKKRPTLEELCLTPNLATTIWDVPRQTPTTKKFIIHLSHQLVLHHPRQTEISHRSKTPDLIIDPNFIIMTYSRYRKNLTAKPATSLE